MNGEPVTLTIALAGLAMGAVSLGWQVWTWRSAGPRVRVDGHMAFIPDRSGVIRLAVGVTAANRGRSSVQVGSWGFRFADGQQAFAGSQHVWNAPTPHTLDGGHSIDWRIPLLSFARQDPRVLQRGLTVWPFVNLGTGERVTGKRYIVEAGVIRDDSEEGDWH